MTNWLYALAAAHQRCGERTMQQPSGMAPFPGLPSDIRGLCLALAWAGVAVLGAVAALIGEPPGLLLLLVGLIGYATLSWRGVQVLLWLAVVVSGAVVATAAMAVGAGLVVVGLVAAGTAASSLITPPPAAPVAQGTDQATNPPDGGRIASILDARTATVSVRAIGVLSVDADGIDFAQTLRERPAIQFTWVYLLARALAGGEASISRTALADELNPGLDPDQQRRRLRSHLFDLTHRGLPDALLASVVVDRQQVAIDVSKLDVDVVRLRQAAAVVSESPSLDVTTARHVRAFLERLGSADFLEGFEELERMVTRAGGTAGDTVAAVRQEVRRNRALVAACLAEHYLSVRRPEDAIAVLEPVADESTEEASRLLVHACVEAGQTARAGELRRRLSPVASEV